MLAHEKLPAMQWPNAPTFWLSNLTFVRDAESRLSIRREIFSEYYQIKPNFDCNYTFRIDLTPNGFPFGAKSIGTVYLKSKFGIF